MSEEGHDQGQGPGRCPEPQASSPCARELSEGEWGKASIGTSEASTAGGRPELTARLDSGTGWPHHESVLVGRKEKKNPGTDLQQTGQIQAPGLINNPSRGEPGALRPSPAGPGAPGPRFHPWHQPGCQERGSAGSGSGGSSGLVCCGGQTAGLGKVTGSPLRVQNWWPSESRAQDTHLFVLLVNFYF